MRLMLPVVWLLLSLASYTAAQPLPIVDFQSPGVALPGPSFRYDASFDVLDWNDDGKPDIFLLATGTVGGQVNLNEGTTEEPKFGHSVGWPFNSTETHPQTIEHVSAYTWCDLQHNGLAGIIFFDGQLRYCPNTGTKHGPFHWNLWKDGAEDRTKFFPGTERFVKENARFSTGPQSMYWNKGVFARQVLTMTAADWDGDGLQDLLICRFKSEAPGVTDLGAFDGGWRREQWTAWGRQRDAFPPAKAIEVMQQTGDFSKPLAAPPDRELYFYKNLGTKETPRFDAGVEITTADGKSIAAPNPVVADMDGDGRPDLVSSETAYSCNAFRVDWPTNPHVVWFRRTADAVDKLEPQQPVVVDGQPVPAGTAVRLADLRKHGALDLMVMDPGGTIRWYRNAADAKHPLRFEPSVSLRGRDFLRFEFMWQPIVVDWFGKGSRDLILHGCTDAHCKFGLRRTALYRNVAKQPGELKYELAGYLNYQGDREMVSTRLEEQPYEIYGSAMCVVPEDGSGKKRVMMSVGGRLYYFSDLAEDGLTFRTMIPLNLPSTNNRLKGWQEISVNVPEKVKYVRIMNDRNGIGNLRDSMLHVQRFEAYSAGVNVVTPEFVSLDYERGTDTNYRLADNPKNMFLAKNEPGAQQNTATTFGYYLGPAIVTFKEPVQLEKIRFLLADRDTLWYTHLAPFSWQGTMPRLGMELGEQWYQYKVEVSADGKKWSPVADRLQTEILVSHPQCVDWDQDGVSDLLLGVTTANGVYPKQKTYRLYKNHGSNDEPRFDDFQLCTDETGKPLALQANWILRYAPQCGVALCDLYGDDGKLDLIVEQDGTLAYYRNVSESVGGVKFKSEGHTVALGGRSVAGHPYRYFHVGDVDGDKTPDVIDCGSGSAVFYKGLSREAPERVVDLVETKSDESGVRLQWTRPRSAARFEIRWCDEPISEANWLQLDRQTGDYDASGAPQVLTLTDLPAGRSIHVAIKSTDTTGRSSGLSNELEVASFPLKRTILRNGPERFEGEPAYDSCVAVDLIATPPAEQVSTEPETLRVRSRDSNAVKGSESVILLRFGKLPALGKVESATLEMTLAPSPRPAAMTTLAVSCNAFHGGWDPQTATWTSQQNDQQWKPRELERGGTCQSFVNPVFTVDNRRRTWDVSEVLRDAQRTGATEVNLLVRVDYTGHYVAGQGLVFCGPAWKAVDERPKLVLTTRVAR